ncbi:MAG: hypothetical protein CL885_01590 [Dehalococcoidia bacterium]|nr:hypothetical protein [Dehalococcoidia bacterium]
MSGEEYDQLPVSGNGVTQGHYRSGRLTGSRKPPLKEYSQVYVLSRENEWQGEFITTEDELFNKSFDSSNWTTELNEWSDIKGHWIYSDISSQPFVFRFNDAHGSSGTWQLLRLGINSRIEYVYASEVEAAHDAANGGAVEVEAHVLEDPSVPQGNTYSISTNTPVSNQHIDNSALPGHKLLLDGVSVSSSSHDLRKDKELYYAYNTIAGGNDNLINRSSNTCLVGSSGSVVHNLKGGVVGGLNNTVIGRAPEKYNPGDSATNWPEIQNSNLSVLGSNNIFNYNTHDPSAINLDRFQSIQSVVFGSENVIFGSRRTVVLGSGNHIKGAEKSTQSSFSKIKGQEVNILGTDNEVVVEGGYANNLSIFGSNFKLRNSEQIQNAYYIGNPKAEDQFLARVYVAADGGAYFTGDVITFALSDKRHKGNVVTIESPVEKIMALRGVSFEWKDTQKVYSGEDIGVIAQEVEKVLPEVVEDRKSGKGVKYEKIVPLLIEGIKAQQKTIEGLLSRIESLESRVD